VPWYVKGGAAVTHNTYSSLLPVGNAFAAAGVPFNQASDTRWGGTVGTGIEVGFAANWSVAFEYDHLFMGNPNVTFPQSNIAMTRSDNIRWTWERSGSTTGSAVPSWRDADRAT
jgi:outer membrane immunogenic protein